MIRFACSCGKQLQAREEYAGQVVACPVCKQQQTVPSPEGVIEAEAPLEPAPVSRGVRRERPDLAEDDYDDRPRRRSVVEMEGSGKATASLVLGILAIPCLCSLLTGIPAVILGLMALGDIRRSKGRLGGRGMAMTGTILGGVFSLLSLVLIPFWYFGVDRVREAAARAESTNNLKQIALAMHNYNDVYGGFFPANANYSPNGKPLLSWRVHLLPYLEQDILYRQFKLDEPWDGPNNIRLLAQMPKIYKLPGDTKLSSDQTVYQVFVGPGTMFETGPERNFKGIRFPMEVPDGSSNTILVVEAAQGVPWTKPDDLVFAPNRPLPPLGGHFRSGFNAAFADGSVRLIPQDTPESTLKAAITRNGGEIVNLPP
jgi:prepilin-type processing-associated H-X9-DG protein